MLVTGFYPYWTGGQASEQQIEQLAACIKQFILITSHLKVDNELEVYTSESIWNSILGLVPKLKEEKKVRFRDVEKFLKQFDVNLEKDLWYDSLKFVVLANISEHRRIWIDPDTLICSNTDIFKLDKEDDRVVFHIPSDFTVSGEVLEKLQRYCNEKDIVYSQNSVWKYCNGGNMFGGSSEEVQQLCEHVLDFVRYWRRNGEPSFSPQNVQLIEWGSNCLPLHLCTVRNFRFVYGSGVFHWTGCLGLPWEATEFFRNQGISENLLNASNCRDEAYEFRKKYMNILQRSILKNDRMFDSELAVKIARRYPKRMTLV